MACSAARRRRVPRLRSHRNTPRYEGATDSHRGSLISPFPVSDSASTRTAPTPKIKLKRTHLARHTRYDTSLSAGLARHHSGMLPSTRVYRMVLQLVMCTRQWYAVLYQVYRIVLQLVMRASASRCPTLIRRYCRDVR